MRVEDSRIFNVHKLQTKQKKSHPELSTPKVRLPAPKPCGYTSFSSYFIESLSHNAKIPTRLKYIFPEKLQYFFFGALSHLKAVVTRPLFKMGYGVCSILHNSVANVPASCTTLRCLELFLISVSRLVWPKWCLPNGHRPSMGVKKCIRLEVKWRQ